MNEAGAEVIVNNPGVAAFGLLPRVCVRGGGRGGREVGGMIHPRAEI